MSYERSSGYTLESTYTDGVSKWPNRAQQWGANNHQLGDLNPFWVGTRLLCIETLIECMH